MAKGRRAKSFNPLRLKIRFPFTDSGFSVLYSVWDTARMRRMSPRRQKKTIMGTRNAPPTYMRMVEYDRSMF